MSTKRYANDFYLTKSLGNNSLYDSIEEQVRDTIEDYTHENVLALDGSAAEPSIGFSADLNTGMFRVGDDTIGFSTNGIERLQIGTANTDIANGFRLAYQSGSPQLSFQLADNTYALKMFTDSNEDFYIRHDEFDKNIYLEHAAAACVTTRPNSPTITNTEFCVLVGDGASTYNTVFEANEQFIRSANIHRFSNGSVGSPAVTFNNDTNCGLYLIGADDVGLSTGGALEMSWNASNITAYDPILVPNGSAANPTYSFSNFTGNGMYSTASTSLEFSVGGVFQMGLNTSTDALVLNANNLLFPNVGDIVITNQSDECIRFETASEQISFEIGGNNKMVWGTSETISLQNIRLNDGFQLVFDADGSVDAQAGSDTLVGGKVTVSCNHIQVDDIIMLSYGVQGSLTNSGQLYVDTITANTSFVIESTNLSDANIVNWFIVKNN